MLLYTLVIQPRFLGVGVILLCVPRYDMDQRGCEMTPSCAANPACINAYGSNLSTTLVKQPVNHICQTKSLKIWIRDVLCSRIPATIGAS